MTTKKKSPFGITPRTQKNPWWKYQGPNTANGIGGDLSLNGLLERCIQSKEEIYYWERSGCYDGTLESVATVLGVDQFQVFHKMFQGKPDPLHGDNWPDDPRPPSKLVYFWDNGSLSLVMSADPEDPVIFLEIWTTEEDTYWKIRRWGEDNLIPVGRKGFVRCLSRRGPNKPFQLIHLGRFKNEYIPENYSPQVIKQFESIVEDINSVEPKGRLSILHGPPGTGKTYLLRALTQRCPDAMVVFVPNTLVNDLGNPELIEVFSDHRSDSSQAIVLIAEDADVIFRARSEGNTNAISSALNLTDGMFGELLNIFIVGTTNVPLEDIDEAVKRPGRLSEEILVSKLSFGQSAKIYQRLKGKEAPIPDNLKEGATLAEIYNTAGVRQTRKKKRKVPKASLRNKAMRNWDVVSR